MCACSKRRENLILTNWQRHLDNCKKRKTKNTSRSITSFFNTPKPKKICIDADTISYSYPAKDGEFYTWINNLNQLKNLIQYPTTNLFFQTFNIYYYINEK